jgi:Protein of unknown function (DUF760)
MAILVPRMRKRSLLLLLLSLAVDESRAFTLSAETACSRSAPDSLQFVFVESGRGRSATPTPSRDPCARGGRRRRPWVPFLNLSSKGGYQEEGGDGTGDDDISKFLDPNYRESEPLQRAREFLSDNSAPITADLDLSVEDPDLDAEDPDSDDQQQEGDDPADKKAVGRRSDAEAAPAAVTPVAVPRASGRPNSLDLAQPSLELTKEGLERNPYMAVISRLSPSELISRFTSTANPRVQNAVRQTILGMLGGLPKLAFETTTFTTAQRLASLMFQLQMTGYMFKNAEYLLSLRQSLGDYSDSQYLLTGDDDDDDDDRVDLVDPKTTKIRGKIRIPLADPSEDSEGGSDNESGEATNGTIPALEVDAAAYMGELRQEVAQLRRELETARQAKEEALRKDLLLYIRTLPEQELRSLTNTMSSDVLVAMKGLVNAVLAGIGEDGQEPITPQTVTEQSGEAMAQLCMWQLAIGYNLRTLEVREEMKKSIAAAPDLSGPVSATGLGPDDGVFE